MSLKGVKVMIPIFQSESPNRRLAVKVLMVSLLIALGAGLFLIVLRGGASAWAMTLGAVALSMLILGTMAFVYATRYAEKAKPKRDGQDMYTLIDRLVDDLDDDERAYLQKRLDEHHSVKNGELAQSVENLLDRRSQNRQP